MTPASRPPFCMLKEAVCPKSSPLSRKLDITHHHFALFHQAKIEGGCKMWKTEASLGFIYRSTHSLIIAVLRSALILLHPNSNSQNNSNWTGGMAASAGLSGSTGALLLPIIEQDKMSSRRE